MHIDVVGVVYYIEDTCACDDDGDIDVDCNDDDKTDDNVQMFMIAKDHNTADGVV